MKVWGILLAMFPPLHVFGERRRDVSRLCRHTSSALQALSPVLVRRQAGLWILFAVDVWRVLKLDRRWEACAMRGRKGIRFFTGSRSCRFYGRFYGQFYGRLRCRYTSILHLFIDFTFPRLPCNGTPIPSFYDESICEDVIETTVYPYHRWYYKMRLLASVRAPDKLDWLK